MNIEDAGFGRFEIILRNEFAKRDDQKDIGLKKFEQVPAFWLMSVMLLNRQDANVLKTCNDRSSSFMVFSSDSVRKKP